MRIEYTGLNGILWTIVAGVAGVVAGALVEAASDETGLTSATFLAVSTILIAIKNEVAKRRA